MISSWIWILICWISSPSAAFSAPLMITIRPFQEKDCAAIALLFHETVRSVNLGDYTRRQVEAWAPDDLNFRDWKTACKSRWTVVAETNGIIAGFAELESNNGHVDCFYCHKDYQCQGIGKQLYRAIEDQAKTEGHDRLLVEASITAKPFFERMGFVCSEEQLVSCRGEFLTTYKMEKWLD